MIKGDLQVFKLDNIFIFKKARHSKFFYTTNDSMSIPVFNFISMLEFMLFRGLLDPKDLENVLDGYRNSRE